MKKFLIILFLLGFASTTNAITLSTSTSLDVLYVNVFHNNKWSGWSNHADVTKGDKVWFQIHSYANGGKVTNLVSKLENIDGKNFTAGQVKTVTSFIDASNASRINDSVALNFLSNVKLSYAGKKWAIKLKGPTPEANEHVKPLPYGQSGRAALSASGVRLGDLENDYRSNLLIFFDTGDYKPPVDGVCNVKKNSCLKGRFFDVKDDSEYYKWRCGGFYGGKSDECSIKKIPIDAICSNYVNKCRAGFFTDIKNDKEYYIWKCNGLNGGGDSTCKVKKMPINGVCGRSLNRCSRGVFNDVRDTYEKKLWICKGIYGGKDTSCSIQKMCPCTLNKVVNDSSVVGNRKEECNTTIGNSNNGVNSTNVINDNCSDILRENKDLKIKLKNLSRISPSEISIKNIIDNGLTFKSWYWILIFIYSLILLLAGLFMGRKRN